MRTLSAIGDKTDLKAALSLLDAQNLPVCST